MLSVPGLLFWTTLFSLGSCGTTCSHQNYKSHLLFEDPLVIYIENFISIEEASQLVGLR
jgi:prolyl 4-hydroxylase